MPDQPLTTLDSTAHHAFESLFRAHYAAIHDFVARYVIAPDVAADVTQEVFLDAWSRWETQLAAMSPRDRLLYLYRAARNRAMNVLAHARVERDHAPEIAEAQDERNASAWTPAALDAETIAQLTRHTVDRMPERMRLVYTLNRRDGLTYHEIAQLLGISVNTVKTQMGRALDMLRSALGPFLATLLVLGHR